MRCRDTHCAFKIDKACSQSDSKERLYMYVVARSVGRIKIGFGKRLKSYDHRSSHLDQEASTTVTVHHIPDIASFSSSSFTTTATTTGRSSTLLYSPFCRGAHSSPLFVHLSSTPTATTTTSVQHLPNIRQQNADLFNIPSSASASFSRISQPPQDPVAMDGISRTEAGEKQRRGQQRRRGGAAGRVVVN